MVANDPDERRLVSTLGAHASWAKTPDRSARTAPARAALDAKFEREVDPDGVLAPDERARRAASARKAHFARLTLRSAQVRRAKAATRKAAQAADVPQAGPASVDGAA